MRKQIKTRSVKKCPRCNSTEIFLDGRRIDMGQFYKCNKCGYMGQFVIEEDVEMYSKRERPERKK